MLVCLGYDVDLELTSGEMIRCAPSATLLYDKTGAHWPATSILIKGFRRSGEKHAPTRFSKSWFGRSYELREGEAYLPDRSSNHWKKVGHVARIFYTRGSGDAREAKHEGPYEHSFTERSLFDVFTFRAAHLPELLELGRALRLEIGRHHTVTARGIVAA